jgi:hypothetical protein
MIAKNVDMYIEKVKKKVCTNKLFLEITCQKFKDDKGETK